MCGICGFIDFNKNSDSELLNQMTSTMHHRGPDDQGGKIYNFGTATIGLGQNRLSIIDLSSGGHQPMLYKHLSIVFNGEIYNYQEIKNELLRAGHVFNSGSDTEVIIHSFEEWGHKCVNKFIGMFAFVILDESSQKITIFRDRAGVKPLYYYYHNGLFMFASELKAFHKHPEFTKEINEVAVHQYMHYGFIPAPNCIFNYCNKLEPGHLLTIDITNQKQRISKYWDVNDFYQLPKLNISYNDAMQKVELLLLSAFEYRMVADVPVGVFLSGGYDSTAVAALLQSSRKSTKIKTFTIGFVEGNNEAPFARTIAEYIGTDHTEYYCTTKEAQDIIPTLPFFYDEPFADSSAIPTILVSKVARQQVTVALSADGGDEIFAGYTYYNTFLNNLLLLDKIPEFARYFLSILAKGASVIVWGNKLANKLDVLSSVLNTDRKLMPAALHCSYFKKISKRERKALFINNIEENNTGFNKNNTGVTDKLSIALATDYSVYMQNDILTKVDRATMSVSLEGREPFIDHRIVELAAQFPNEYKYGKTQKMILKDIVHKYIPKQLMDRPKTGFLIPIDIWLKTDLSYLLEENLNVLSIIESGFFKPSYVEKLKKDFYNDRLDDPEIIWKLLQFQMWYKEWMK